MQERRWKPNGRDEPPASKISVASECFEAKQLSFSTLASICLPFHRNISLSRDDGLNLFSYMHRVDSSSGVGGSRRSPLLSCQQSHQLLTLQTAYSASEAPSNYTSQHISQPSFLGVTIIVCWLLCLSALKKKQNISYLSSSSLSS